jgi:hypothetical protein
VARITHQAKILEKFFSGRTNLPELP